MSRLVDKCHGVLAILRTKGFPGLALPAYLGRIGVWQCIGGFTMRRILIVLAGAAALAIAAGTGVAFASIPASSGVIHGCYSNETGMLRVIDASAQTCKSSETALTWSQNAGAGMHEVFNGVSFPTGLPNGSFKDVRVYCPAGQVAVNGGWALSGPMGVGGNATEDWTNTGSSPIAVGGGKSTGWEASVVEAGTPSPLGAFSNYILNAYATCAPG